MVRRDAKPTDIPVLNEQMAWAHASIKEAVVGLLTGKVGIVMGVANNRSIAAAVAELADKEGAELAFSHLPDERGKMRQRLDKVLAGLARPPRLVAPCDANSDGDIADFFAGVGRTYGKVDFLVHSIAFAPLEDIRCPTVSASRAGFLTAMETSVYSLIAVARAAAPLLNPGGSIVTMTYFGGEKVVAGYNLMGVVKAGLESAVRYLAYDLGPQGIRVNAISAGPIKTLASSAIGGISSMLTANEAIAPLGRNVNLEEVGKASLYLLSDLGSGVTGEIMHVDAGYHIMGSPGRALERWGVDLTNASS